MAPPFEPDGPLDRTDARASGETVILPLLEEELSVGRRTVETARVRVERQTQTREQLIDELLRQQKVEIEHIPVGRTIETMPSVRQEGDVTIIPVVEEVLKIERSLVLKEEVHIRRVETTVRHQEQVTLRRQEATVSRTPISHPSD